MMQEAAMMAGIPITPENANRIRSVAPKLENLMNRFQQRVTALNFAIQTTPPPDSPESRRELHALNLELFQLYMSANALDLARDRLQLVLDTSQPEDFAAEVRAQFKKQFDELDQQMKLVEDSLVELETERQAGPVEQAAFALSRGAAGRAISLLADAERNNLSPAVVKPRLIDLYCNTGQPDKALDLLAAARSTIPTSAPSRGRVRSRQGRVYFLLGNYLSAASLWRERAIPRVRIDRSSRALEAARALVRGEAVQATNIFLTVPGTLAKQASWEFDLAMCELEAGLPDDAASISPRPSPWPPTWPFGRSRPTTSRKWASPFLSSTKSDAPRPPRPGSSADTPGASHGTGSDAGEGNGTNPRRTRRRKPASPQPSGPAEKAKAVAPQATPAKAAAARSNWQSTQSRARS